MNAETRAALALVAAGMPERLIERGLSLLDTTSTSTPEQITAAVDALADEVPALFKAEPLRAVPKPEGLSGPAMNKAGKEALRAAGIRVESAQDRARERFERTFPNLPGGYDRHRGTSGPGGDAA